MADRRRSDVWSPRAERDFLEIWTYLATEASAEVASVQLRAIDRTVNRLTQWPLSGRARDELIAGVRSIVVGQYVVFYRASDDLVEIIRVLHGSRDIDHIFSDPSGMSE